MPPAPQFDFGPYAQILKTLLPRARGIYLYAPDGDLLWSADGADSHDLRPAVEELLETAKQGASTRALLVMSVSSASRPRGSTRAPTSRRGRR